MMRLLKAICAAIMATFTSPEELEDVCLGCKEIKTCNFVQYKKRDKWYRKHNHKTTDNQKQHIIALVKKAHKTAKYKPPVKESK